MAICFDNTCLTRLDTTGFKLEGDIECNAKLLYCSISKHPIPDIGEQMGATLDGWNDIAAAVLFVIPELEVKEVEKDTCSLRQSRRINVGLTCSEAYVSSQDGRDLIGGFESLRHTSYFGDGSLSNLDDV